MAFNGFLLEDWLVILGIGAKTLAAFVIPPGLKEKLRDLQIALFVHRKSHFLLQFRPLLEQFVDPHEGFLRP